jgi:transcription initiation factor IIE alpha subunit
MKGLRMGVNEEFTCPTCGAELELTMHSDDTGEYFYWIRPNCDHLPQPE